MADEQRRCAAPGCGKALVRRGNEPPSVFAKRRCCDLVCGMKLRALARRREPAAKPCAVCGVEMRRVPGQSTADFRRNKTCSTTCRYTLMANTQRHDTAPKSCAACGAVIERRDGEKTHQFNKRQTCGDACGAVLSARKRERRVTLSCERCGESFVVHEGRSNEARFCSRSCAGAARCITRTCETCGKTYLASERKGKRFCSLLCSGIGQRTRVTRACERCDKPYQATPAAIAHGARFCSKACQLAKTEKTCEACGAAFSVKPSHAAGARFCSRKCRRVEKVTLTCNRCGKGFDVYPAQQAVKRFCSRACHYATREVFRTCVVCGTRYRRSVQGGKLYCCDDCRHVASRHQVEGSCEVCGVGFSVPYSERGRRFCSWTCRGIGRAPKPRPCEECGASFVPARGQGPRYCSTACGRRVGARKITKQVEFRCERCGESFTRAPSTAAATNPRFCSRTCKHEAMRGERIPLNCEGCGKTWMGWPSQRDRKYCSRKCAAPFIGNKRLALATKGCVACGVVFERRADESAGNFRKRMTCSAECHHERSARTRLGITPRRSPYPVDFSTDLKRRIKKRDGNRCRLCGVPDGHGRLCVHHIDYNKDHGADCNLITLCRSCHSKTNGNREYWKEQLTGMMASDEAARERCNDAALLEGDHNHQYQQCSNDEHNEPSAPSAA